MDRPFRSQKYQYQILEVPWGDAYNMETIFHLDNSQESEERYELRERLAKATLDLAKRIGTKHQLSVLLLILDGYTQMEVADKLNIIQSSVTKSLHGNIDYKTDKRKKYGGFIKKLKLAAAQDPVIQDILQQLQELEE